MFPCGSNCLDRTKVCGKTCPASSPLNELFGRGIVSLVRKIEFKRRDVAQRFRWREGGSLPGKSMISSILVAGQLALPTCKKIYDFAMAGLETFTSATN